VSEEPFRFCGGFSGALVEEAMARTREPTQQHGQEDSSREKRPNRHSDHGIVKDEKAEEQPKDKRRAQLVHKTDNG